MGGGGGLGGLAPGLDRGGVAPQTDLPLNFFLIQNHAFNRLKMV